MSTLNVAGPSSLPSTHQSPYYSEAASTQQYDHLTSICGGCQKTIDSEAGGVVVAFGSSLWHTDCFRCAKCGDQVSADTTLLLLADGSPICSNCSYSCHVCKKPIMDEAIMTGDDSYHASCFTCRSCHKQIDALVFAKTSQGIYCMDCHNDRVARSRRHAEQRQAKNKSRRPKDARSPHPENRTPQATPKSEASPQTQPSPYSISVSPSPAQASSTPDLYYPTPRQKVPQDIDSTSFLDQTDSSMLIPQSDSHLNGTTLVSSPADIDGGHSFSTTLDKRDTSTLSERTLTKERVDTLPLPSNANDLVDGKRRKSYDDGVRPLQSFFGAPSSSGQASLSPSGLDVPGRTSRAEKRRSINPGLFPRPGVAPRRSSLSTSDANPVRSGSPDSVNTAYYSPALSPVDGGASPMSEAQGIPRTATPLGSHSQSVPILNANGTGSANGNGKPVETASTSRSFPPRGQSLPINRANKSHEVKPTTNSGSTLHSQSSPRPSLRPELSFSVDAASDDEGEGANEAPRPPPKDDVEERPETPRTPQSAGDEEESDEDEEPQINTEPIQLSLPPLVPIRFSLHESDFSDILRVISGSPPRVPLPRDSGVHTKITPIGEEPPSSPSPSPSEAANQQIISLTSSSQSTPTVVQVPFNDDTTTEVDEISTPILVTPLKPARKQSGGSDTRGQGLLGGSYSSMANGSSASLAPSLRPSISRNELTDLASRRLRDALQDAGARGSSTVKLDLELVEAVLKAMDGTQEANSGLKGDIDKIKRASHQYLTGFTFAQEEYQRQIATSRNLQDEVGQLRVQIAGQAAQIAVLSSSERSRASMNKIISDLAIEIADLGRQVANLRVERDTSRAEIEELTSFKKSGSKGATTNLSRSLAARLDRIKAAYIRDLEALQQRREHVHNEVADLREARDIFLEETTALNSRNEQLADLNTQIAQQIQHAGVQVPPPQITADASSLSLSVASDAASIKVSSMRGRKSADQRSRYSPSVTSLNTIGNSTLDTSDESTKTSTKLKPDTSEPAHHQQKKFKWFGAASTGIASSKTPPPTVPEKMKGHNFVSANVLRFSRCDVCCDKLWGAQLRCTNCSFACHIRCGALVKGSCKHSHSAEDSTAELLPLPPSMFGRDLIEQVHSDAQGSSRDIPIIVEKCIQAVEAAGLDYEGIYRKTGGSSQSKAITQLFERGQYESFDLSDTDAFNDISSITSVLKNYFRALPTPLLTFDLHESFVQATSIKDPRDKQAAITALVHDLPREHYHTLRALMLHLNRIRVRSDENLMTARNLGVVFGPTLMRSRDTSQEFADMAGKALMVEWLVDNAPAVFQEPVP